MIIYEKILCSWYRKSQKAISKYIVYIYLYNKHLNNTLKYLEEIPEKESLWQGECFVFDNRTAVGHGLALGDHTRCYGCRSPLAPEDRNHEHFKEGVHCSYCYTTRSQQQFESAQARHYQVLLAEQRHQYHLGDSRD